MSLACQHCGGLMTAEERLYYISACEECEREKMARIHAWRHVAPDKELDRMYDGPEWHDRVVQ